MALYLDRDAEAHLRHCLHLDPSCGAAYRLMAEIELRRDRPGDALRLLDEACRLEPGDKEARDLRAVVSQRARGRAAGGETPQQGAGPAPSHARDVASGPAAGEADASRPRARQRAADVGARPRQRTFARGTDGPTFESARPSSLRHGFGAFLAEAGILSRAQVRAALIYRRTRGVGLGEAALALGFLSEEHLRWAAANYRARVEGDA